MMVNLVLIGISLSRALAKPKYYVYYVKLYEIEPIIFPVPNKFQTP